MAQPDLIARIARANGRVRRLRGLQKSVRDELQQAARERDELLEEAERRGIHIERIAQPGGHSR